MESDSVSGSRRVLKVPEVSGQVVFELEGLLYVLDDRRFFRVYAGDHFGSRIFAPFFYPKNK